LKEIFTDPEDGTNLTFVIENNTNPVAVTPIVQASGALTLQFPKDGSGSAEITIKALDSAQNYVSTKFPVIVYDPDKGNIALLKPATSSTVESDLYKPEFAVDGEVQTRWSTQYQDDQWLQLDLQGAFTINKVVLRWEVAYGKDYRIEVSDDGQNWKTVVTEPNSDGGADEFTFEPVKANYVRMYGVKRGTGWGFSLWEFEVYGERVKR